MRRGTTPTIIITTDVDLTSYDTVILTIKDRRGKQVDIEKEHLVITSENVSATLTQEQTLLMNTGDIELQIRAALGDKAIASNIMNGRMSDILKDGVIGLEQ